MCLWNVSSTALHNLPLREKKKSECDDLGALPSLLASQAVLALQVHQVAPEKKDTGKNSDK